jgi:hypothetical protein
MGCRQRPSRHAEILLAGVGRVQQARDREPQGSATEALDHQAALRARPMPRWKSSNLRALGRVAGPVFAGAEDRNDANVTDRSRHVWTAGHTVAPFPAGRLRCGAWMVARTTDDPPGCSGPPPGRGGVVPPRSGGKSAQRRRARGSSRGARAARIPPACAPIVPPQRAAAAGEADVSAHSDGPIPPGGRLSGMNVEPASARAFRRSSAERRMVRRARHDSR